MPLMWQEQSLQMEWCLDCHRNPERYVRPRERGVPHRLRAARRISSSSARGWSRSTRFRSSRAARRVTDERRHATRSADSTRSRPARRRARPRVLAQPRGAGRRPGVSRSILHHEFPQQAAAIDRPGRRAATFLKLMGASLALAGVTACTRQPAEKIVPYVRQPEELIPGKPLFYATAMPLGGVATGLLVESHEGRPTKIEGNPLHPGSLGATDVFAQAAILGLYDPDRSQTLTNLGEIRPWSAFLGAIRAALDGAAAAQGRRPAHPHRDGHLADAGRADPRAARALPVGEVAPVGSGRAATTRAPARSSRSASTSTRSTASTRPTSSSRSTPTSSAAARRACATRATSPRAGAPEQADRDEPALRRRDACRRRPARAPTIGCRCAPSEIEAVRAGAGRARSASARRRRGDRRPARQREVGRRRRQGSAGAPRREPGHRRRRPAAGRPRAGARDERRRSATSARRSSTPSRSRPSRSISSQSLRELVADMNAGKVDLLVILGGNPVYTAPADLEVRRRARARCSSASTSSLLRRRDVGAVPLADSRGALPRGVERRARATTAPSSIVQPLIAPLYGGRSAHEVLAALQRPAGALGLRHRARATGRRQLDGRRLRARLAALRCTTASSPARRSPPKTVDARAARRWRTRRRDAGRARGGLEIVFRPDPTIYDGRFANNGWLQELPKPITKLTWDNAVLVEPGDGRRGCKVAEHAVVQAASTARSSATSSSCAIAAARFAAPMFPVAGHPDDCVTVHLGYGRTRAGHVGTGAGFNANAIRTVRRAVVRRAASRSSPTGETLLARVHAVSPPDGRPRHGPRGHARRVRPRSEVGARGRRRRRRARSRCIPTSSTKATSGAWRSTSTPASAATPASSPARRRTTSRWSARTRCCAAARCTGCASTRYYRGDVGRIPRRTSSRCRACSARTRRARWSARSTRRCTATKGLNDMVYNRCVGTRYCSNNCPYKVRRFNFLLYSGLGHAEPQAGAQPRRHGAQPRRDGEVHVLRAAHQRGEDRRGEGGPARSRDGEIMTACQQACPTEAIVFGDLNDPNSRVAQLQGRARATTRCSAS